MNVLRLDNDISIDVEATHVLKKCINGVKLCQKHSPTCFQPVFIFKSLFFPYTPYHSINKKKEFNQVEASQLYKDELII